MCGISAVKTEKGRCYETRLPSRPGVKGLWAECSHPGGGTQGLLPGSLGVLAVGLFCMSSWRQEVSGYRRMCVGDGRQESGRCGDADLSSKTPECE